VDALSAAPRLAAVATALWAVLQRSAEANRPQADGYNIPKLL